MKIKLFLLGVIMTTVAVAGSVNVKILQWNIHFGTDIDKKPALAEQAAVIARIDADVVALNEVDKLASRSNYVDMLKVIAEKANYPYSQFGAAFILPPDGLFGNAVLSRYKLEVAGAWAIPGTAWETRALLLMKVHAPKPFLLAVTHLNAHNSDEEKRLRVEAVKVIDEFLQTNNPENLPIVLVGDFNCGEKSDPVAILKTKNWHTAPFLPTWPANKAYAALDHLYWRGNCQLVERRTVDEQKASDHLPVVNIVKINP